MKPLLPLKPIALTVFFVLTFACGFGQDHYRLAPFRTGAAVGGGGIVFAGARFYRSSISPLTLTQVQGIRTKGPNTFDGLFAGGRYSDDYRRASDVMHFANLAPVAFYALPKYRGEYLTLNIMALEAFTLTAAVTQLVKVLAKRPRPFVYHTQDIYDPHHPDARLSFFSGHTSSIAAISFMMAKTAIDINGDTSRKRKILIYATAATVPAMMGALRMAAGKHFMTDVMTGYIVGAGFGLLVPRWHRL